MQQYYTQRYLYNSRTTTKYSSFIFTYVFLTLAFLVLFLDNNISLNSYTCPLLQRLYRTAAS